MKEHAESTPIDSALHAPVSSFNSPARRIILKRDVIIMW